MNPLLPHGSLASFFFPVEARGMVAAALPPKPGGGQPSPLPKQHRHLDLVRRCELARCPSAWPLSWLPVTANRDPSVMRYLRRQRLERSSRSVDGCELLPEQEYYNIKYLHEVYGDVFPIRSCLLD